MGGWHLPILNDLMEKNRGGDCNILDFVRHRQLLVRHLAMTVCYLQVGL